MSVMRPLAPRDQFAEETAMTTQASPAPRASRGHGR